MSTTVTALTDPAPAHGLTEVVADRARTPVGSRLGSTVFVVSERP